MLILAPDPSGDFIASKISKSWIRNTKIRVKALGGKFLKGSGANVFIDQAPFSTIGFVDAVANLGKTFKEYKKIEEEISKSSILVVVDARYLLERFAPIAKSLNIPVVWVAPSPDWKEKGATTRTKRLEVLADLLLVTDEMSWIAYRKNGMSIRVKNPHLDLATNHNKDFLGFFPGSRKKEVERLLPVFLRLANEFSSKKIIISDAFGHLGDEFKNFSNVQVHKGDSKEIIPLCRVAVACSGTLVQQCVVSKTPVISIYKTSSLMWGFLSFSKAIGKTPRFWSHPNIFADSEIVPERIQNSCSSEILQKDIRKLWKDEKSAIEKFKDVRSKYILGKDLEGCWNEIYALLKK